MWKRLFLYGGGTLIFSLGGFSAFCYYKPQDGAISANTFYQNAPIPSRETMLERMKNNRFDLIVIGGGATGSGVTLDAATRGLSCALVEADDFGGGTSGKSTKLIHGGVRYLEVAFKTLDKNQFSLVWEALQERAHLMKCATYMSTPLGIVLPVYKYWEIPYFWLGIKAYDLLAKLVCGFDTGLPSCYFSNKSNTLQNLKLLKNHRLKGSFVYYDGQHNDSRMNLHIALTSCMENYVEGQRAASIANHVKVLKLLKNSENQIAGVHVQDTLTNEEFDIYGKVVVNCTGPFADTIRRMDNPECKSLVIPTAGVHVIFPKMYSSTHGMLIPNTSDGRILFFLPWENNTLAGTTDAPSVLTDSPKAYEDDVEFILTEAAKFLDVDSTTLRKDIGAAWSGLRPLIKNPKSLDKETQELARSHEIVVEPSGLVSILGGKWTTYRRMAQDGIDVILKREKMALSPKYRCRTKNLVLLGSVDSNNAYSTQAADFTRGKLPMELLSKYPSLTFQQAEHLSRNYGFRAFDVCKLGKEMDLLLPLLHDQPVLKAEIPFSVRHEMARLPSDIIGRRTRIALVDANGTKNVLNEIIDLMGVELHWEIQQKESAKVEALKYLETMQVHTASEREFIAPNKIT